MGGQRRVVVIGGGVSGLATAYHLTRRRPGPGDTPSRVTVLEAARTVGGRIETKPVAAVLVDTGPDALLMRSPAATALVADLGLDPLLRAPGGGGAYLWVRGRLRPLPPGSVFGVPQRLLPLLRSGLLGPVGFARAGADLVLPRLDTGPDPTIESLLRPRFGRQVYERLVEPMLGGVHAGDAGRLSARSAVPEVAGLAARHRSLYLALRGREAAPPAASGSGAGAPRPALMTLEGGLSVLVDALRAAVEASAGGRVLTGAGVRRIEVLPDGRGYRVTGDGFDPVEGDDVVVATPTAAACRLLAPLAPAVAAPLGAVPYVGVATVILAYRPQDVGPLRGTGFLVPPVERRLLVGCTWLTAKWPHLTSAAPDAADGAAPVLVRGMVGRDGDQVWAGLDDEALATAVRAELAASMGLHAEPFHVHVRRMPEAMPQYTVGHADRVAAVGEALTALPGVHVTGAGYHGVGIASCVAQARETAAAVLARQRQEVATR